MISFLQIPISHSFLFPSGISPISKTNFLPLNSHLQLLSFPVGFSLISKYWGERKEWSKGGRKDVPSVWGNPLNFAEL